ncbi:MAG: hypothetical protein DI567_05210 [Aliarcobacter butzleri]|nr:MAG: hypothetical protein DI567_05210 [Aliarcobacter butzleri]
MENRFDEFSFFEKEYEKELNTKDIINNNFTNILTLLTINLTIFFYFIINTPIIDFFKSEHKISYIIFFISSYFYIIYVLNILIHSYDYYFNNDLYMKLPYSNQLDKYFQTLEKFDSENLSRNINDYLVKFYIESSSQNSKVNEYKIDLQFKIRKLLYLQFIVLFIIFISYYVIMNGDLNTYNVKIKV